MKKDSDLFDKIFKTIVKAMIIISVISIIGNFIAKFPISINFKWVVMIITGIIYFWVEQQNKNTDNMKFILFIVIVFVVIPFGWYDSGGSNNNTISYLFLVMISITFIFYGKKRLFLISSLISVFILLFLTEHYVPQFLKIYDESSQFIDRLIQIPLTLISGFLLVRIFVDAYRREQEKISLYSRELEKANHKLSELSLKDPLSNTYNRRAFDSELLMCINKKCNSHVVLLDIDKFKYINDNFGHLMGDKCIKYIADRLLGDLCGKSFIARWGGDEFALIHYGDIEVIEIAINDLINNIEQSNILDDHKINVSIGITEILIEDTVDTIISRADALMYEAKSIEGSKYIIG